MSNGHLGRQTGAWDMMFVSLRAASRNKACLAWSCLSLSCHAALLEAQQPTIAPWKFGSFYLPCNATCDLLHFRGFTVHPAPRGGRGMAVLDLNSGA